MEKELLKIIEYYNGVRPDGKGKKGAADNLGITVRHVDNCLKGFHVGKSLRKLIHNIYIQIESFGK